MKYFDVAMFESKKKRKNMEEILILAKTKLTKEGCITDGQKRAVYRQLKLIDKGKKEMEKVFKIFCERVHKNFISKGTFKS